METLRHLFNDLPESVCDVVAHYLMLMHEQNIQLCTMRDKLASLEGSRAIAVIPLSGTTSFEQHMHVPDLSVALSCGDNSETLTGSTSASLATDDSSCDAFVGDPHTEMEPDELNGRLHDIMRYNRCWGRMWEGFCDCANLRQWDTIGHVEIARFLPDAQNVLSTSHPDAAIPLSTRIRGGGPEATGAFFFLNTVGGFSRWWIWATYLFFFSIQHASIDFC